MVQDPCVKGRAPMQSAEGPARWAGAGGRPRGHGRGSWHSTKDEGTSGPSRKQTPQDPGELPGEEARAQGPLWWGRAPKLRGDPRETESEEVGMQGPHSRGRAPMLCRPDTGACLIGKLVTGDAFSTAGTVRLGSMPPTSLLSEVPVVEPGEGGDIVGPGLDGRLNMQLVGAGKSDEGGKRPAEQSAPVKKPQFFLAAQGLPTITSKLAQRIWDLEFIEMDDFLPTNKAVQALEQQSTSQLVQDGVLGALQQFQQQQQQGRRVADITTWTRCFTLYIAVMASRRADLVPAMVAHLHAVLKVQQSGGMAWLQFDWRSRREMCAEGTPTWEKRDPWQLLPLFTGKSAAVDPFEVSPQVPLPTSQTPRQPATTAMGPTAKPPVRPQPYSMGPKPKKSGVCRLFNVAPMGCSYGVDCKFLHRCSNSNCRSPDHGRRMCTIPAPVPVEVRSGIYPSQQ